MQNEKTKCEQELEVAPIRKANPASWPKGVRPISIDEVDGIGVDAKGDLYWHGKHVETRARLDLNYRQILYAAAILAFTAIGALGAVGQGWAAYNDWACKVGWPAICP
jgi:hypothetical protein